MDMLSIILVPILAMLGSILASSGFWAFIQSKNRKISSQQQILIGLAHDAIMHRATEYIARGYIYEDELTELHLQLFDPYSHLGGNGTAKKIMDKVDKLEIKTR